FFYEEDRKIPLADRLEKLKAVTFHQKIGTQFQRTMRIKELAGYLAKQLENHELAQVTQRAAELSKTDLLTGIVGEFPTLQGIMGGEYAKHDGERPDVAEAIAEHYLPRGMEGEIPRTLAGKVLSLADRLDKIVSFFWVGVIPKGSEDPYALRRDALSIVRIIIEGRLTLDLYQAIEKAEEGLKKSGVAEAAAGMQQDPLDFIIERLRFYAGTSGSIKRDDVIGAILTPQNKTLSLGDLLDLMSALQAVTAKPDFDPLIVGFKRAHRLTQKEQWKRTTVDPSLFDHPAEGDLHKAWQMKKDLLGHLKAERHYASYLTELVTMKSAIDDFFTNVMVNADNPEVRSNRLSLLKDVDDLFMAFADFSQIVVQGS
ncbi:MAG: glycine--tRNA ligase subunit beta, partial [Nitrospiraceae bacterium]